MLRELNMSEMDMVAGGTAEEDEIIVRGTKIKKNPEPFRDLFGTIEDGSWFAANNFGTFSGPGNGSGSSTTPPETPTSEVETSEENNDDENEGSPGVVTPSEALRCSLIADENRRNACLSKAMFN